MRPGAENIDADEVARFEAMADWWWDPGGALGALHDINRTRVDYVDTGCGLKGKRVCDVGCGGGILAEAMSRRGAAVTGIDAGETPLAVARDHMKKSDLHIDYRKITAEQLAKTEAGTFDAVTCMELLEHVPDPASAIDACGRLVRPGGNVFFATLSRRFLSRFLVIWVAEYLLSLVPRGTHSYEKFIRPEEMVRWAQQAGLEKMDVSGLRYYPVLRISRLGGHTLVNYMAHFSRPR